MRTQVEENFFHDSPLLKKVAQATVAGTTIQTEYYAGGKKSMQWERVSRGKTEVLDTFFLRMQKDRQKSLDKPKSPDYTEKR